MREAEAAEARMSLAHPKRQLLDPGRGSHREPAPLPANSARGAKARVEWGWTAVRKIISHPRPPAHRAQDREPRGRVQSPARRAVADRRGAMGK